MVAPAVDLSRFKNAVGAEGLAEQIRRQHRMANITQMPDDSYRILSWSEPGVSYEVIGDACHCQAAQARLLCWHVVAAEMDRQGRREWEARSRALESPRPTRIPVADLSPEDRDREAAELNDWLFGA